ncbi:MAG: hypothetical protein HY549_12475 [Elusimicrobia bacterium]|nr:hypothetical protein [Elusimicrobiota bacterium]
MMESLEPKALAILGAIPPELWLPGALGIAALFAFLFFKTWSTLRRERRAVADLVQRSQEMEKELIAIRAAAQTREFRIERFDLIWYPTVTYLPHSKRIVSIVPGAPHCRSCFAALSLKGEFWSCPSCGRQSPGSLGDLMVMDAITKETLKHFQERMRGYDLAPGILKA